MVISPGVDASSTGEIPGQDPLQAFRRSVGHKSPRIPGSRDLSKGISTSLRVTVCIGILLFNIHDRDCMATKPAPDTLIPCAGPELAEEELGKKTAKPGDLVRKKTLVHFFLAIRHRSAGPLRDGSITV